MDDYRNKEKIAYAPEGDYGRGEDVFAGLGSSCLPPLVLGAIAGYSHPELELIALSSAAIPTVFWGALAAAKRYKKGYGLEEIVATGIAGSFFGTMFGMTSYAIGYGMAYIIE